MRRRAIVLIDGQNLFHAACREFGYTVPNFDAHKLALLVCNRTDSLLCQTRFYSGVPPAHVDPWWHAYWANKCCQMERSEITTVTRPLKVRFEGGRAVFTEKGIDLRIGLDMVHAAQSGSAEQLILISRDQDFVEAVRESRQIARSAGRRLSIASAFPTSDPSTQGVYQTDWLPICAAEYARCLDPNDHRPSQQQLQSLTQRPTAHTPVMGKLVSLPGGGMRR